MGRAAHRRAGLLRVRPLRHQAGVGLPVRRPHAGPADRHAFPLPARRCPRPLRLPLPCRGCHPVAMLAVRLETWEEAKVILVFHLVGTAMEVFKTAVGSWIYPEASILRIGGVPLFTGFMYAAIGSYIARCWRLFDFRFTHHPPLWALVLLAVGIYLNFFAHHYVWDARVLLFALTALLFGRCWVHFKVWRVHRRMPLLLGFALVALFIWLAENIGTFTAAWMYSNQRYGWELVGFGKLGAWF